MKTTIRKPKKNLNFYFKFENHTVTIPRKVFENPEHLKVLADIIKHQQIIIKHLGN